MSLDKILQRRRAKLVVTQERKVAVDIGGRTQPGSGNQWNAKGDVKSESLLIECKSTIHQSFTLKVDVLEKIEREAALAGREAVLQVEFQGKRRVAKYAVISYDRLLELLELEKTK